MPIIIILTIINLIIYHKIFKVYYFNFGRAMIGEIFGALVVALVEMALLTNVIPLLLGVLGGLFGIIVVIIGIILAVMGLKKFFSVIKNKPVNTSNAAGNKVKRSDINDFETEIFKESEEPIVPGLELSLESKDVMKEMGKVIFCVHCGERIKADSKFCAFCGKAVPEIK